MALIYCPECGHEISNSAVACPNCGRPINGQPVVERKVVVNEPVRKRDGVPTWAIASLGILGALLLFLLIALWGRGSEDEGNQRLRVNVNRDMPSSGRTRVDSDTPASSTVTPTDSQSVTAPFETTVPGSSGSVPAPPTKGTVTIEARVIARNKQPQPVRNEKFYLLDKDLESILLEARVDPIEGQSIIDSLGLAAVFPDRYGEFTRRVMQAIRQHVKYSGTTNGAGKIQLSGVEPESYYLFGFTRNGRGYAVWTAPVTIQPGENILNVSPQPITEISQTTG